MRRDDEARTCIWRFEDCTRDNVVVILREDLTVQHDAPVEHLHRALQCLPHAPKEWRVVPGQQYVDMHESVPRVGQHARDAELARRRDGFA